MQSSVSHGGGGGEPPSKVRLQGETTPGPAHGEGVIEIGDEDDSRSPQARVTDTDVKTEPPDYPNTMPADSTQGPDSKYQLDNETSKSLTNFLDNLMTAHGAGGGGSGSTSQTASNSSPAAQSSSALSHLAHMASPKSEPPSWDHQQQQQFDSPPMSQPPQVRENTLLYRYARTVRYSASNMCFLQAYFSLN